MKRFLKKQWHHLPVGIITAVLLACLVAGGAFAAYGFWSATAEVTVDEPMTVVLAAANANMVFSGDDFTVPLDPGAQVKAGWDVTNNGSKALTVTPSISPSSADGGNITTGWGRPPSSLTSLVVDPGATQRFGLTIMANGSTAPDTYTFTLTFDRS